jgi:hypothetical protein
MCGFDGAAFHGPQLSQISTTQSFDRGNASRVTRSVGACGMSAAFYAKNKVCPCGHCAHDEMRLRVRPVVRQRRSIGL